MNRVVHFEIQVEDPARAIAFYKNVFGWQMEKWGEQDYWMVMTAEKNSPEAGINGGLLLRKTGAPAEGQAVNAFVCTMQVDNIDETIKKIEKEGGKLALPKTAIASMAWQAYYKDTEGNIFGIHQTGTNTK